MKKFTRKPIAIGPIGTLWTFFSLWVVNPFFMGAAQDPVCYDYRLDGMTKE